MVLAQGVMVVGGDGSGAGAGVAQSSVIHPVSSIISNPTIPQLHFWAFFF